MCTSQRVWCYLAEKMESYCGITLGFLPEVSSTRQVMIIRDSTWRIRQFRSSIVILSVRLSAWRSMYWSAQDAQFCLEWGLEKEHLLEVCPWWISLWMHGESMWEFRADEWRNAARICFSWRGTCLQSEVWSKAVALRVRADMSPIRWKGSIFLLPEREYWIWEN